MKFLFFVIHIFSFFNLFLFSEDWKNKLSDYDIIPNINLRFERSDDNNRKVYFKTKFKNFHLILKPTQELFTHDFTSSVVDAYGTKTPIFVNRNQFYEGFVSGSQKSSVRAYLGSEDLVNINILTSEDIFQIESLSRYESSNSSLLVYRYSDLKSNHSKGPLCPSSNLSIPYSNYSDPRRRRSVDDLSFGWKSSPGEQINRFCTIKLVADYRFYREHGKGDMARTHNYLIALIDNINQLFKNTEFIDTTNNKYIGYGFLIKDIIVHTDWTVNIPGHYNEQRSEDPDAWKCEELLNSFGYEDHSDVCLSHLFTYQSFSEGTLGLGWIGTWKYVSEHGGICSSRSSHDGNTFKSVNTAWSTYKDAASNHLISMSAYLVTAHELGHNWGADHDPDSKLCSPNAKGGGKYVMYTYSVVGYESNNRVFSPCSKRSIGETIRIRGKSCFKVYEGGSVSFCGNRRVEKDEQCDIGSNNNRDPCCTDTCQFRPGMVCSPHNHECCTPECQIKARGEICAKADPFNPCLGNGECDGSNRTCLPPKPLSGSKCTEQGICSHGRCKPFCETINLEACICDKMEETCSICCRNRSRSVNKKECQPATNFIHGNDLEYKLYDGRPCSQGFCVDGVCKKKVSKLIERIWKMIDKYDKNLIVGFLLDNLVSVVVIFSLLLWVPASIIVSCYDSRYRKMIINERNVRKPLVTPSANC